MKKLKNFEEFLNEEIFGLSKKEKEEKEQEVKKKRDKQNKDKDEMEREEDQKLYNFYHEDDEKTKKINKE